MGSAEPRAELRRLLESTVGGLLMDGLGWDEVVEVVRERLTGSEPAEAGRPQGAPLVRSSFEPLASEAGVPPPVGPVTALVDGELVHGRRLAPVAEAPAAHLVPDDPGEPPVGSVVTDSRSRVCWRDETGWRRADVAAPLPWSQVVEARGGPDGLPAPGQPTVVSQPPQRVEGPMVLRAAGSMDLPVQHAVLGPDGEPMLGPNGQKLLKTETETMLISEIVPAGGRP